MRKLQFKSPEFSPETASDHKMKLPDDLKRFKDGATELRAHMMDQSLKLACEITDSAVLRTKARGV